ncbi:MAG: DUF4349 domain-containing protein [Gaiellales bacterium]
MKKNALLILLAAALLAAVAGCSGGGGDDGGEAALAGRTVVASEGGGGELAPAFQDTVAAQPISQPLPGIGPKVIQTASLRVSLVKGRFDQTLDEARSIAASLGGFVVSSSASQGRGQKLERGTLVVRVPARAYADAMERLSDLGRVGARRESGQDVSQEYVDLEARARHLEAVEGQLLELLDRADTVAAALAVQSKLNEVQLDLEQTRGRLGFLDDQVTYATISLALHERVAHKAAKNDDGWGIVEAWERAARGFLAVVGWTFVALATAAPVFLLLVLVWLLARSAARRKIGPAWPRLKSD